MDVNGSRHWGLHDDVHWPLDATAKDGAAVVWQRCASHQQRHGALRLRSGLAAGALLALNRSASPVRAAMDAQGAILWWDGEVLVSVGGALRDSQGVLHTPEPVLVAMPDEVSSISAMALGDDGVLYLASGESLWLLDRRNRALPQKLATPGFAASALAAKPGGGVYALDASRGLLARTQGSPLPRQGVAVDSDEGAHFHPLTSHPNPMRLIVLREPLRSDDQGVALALRPDGLLALLVKRSLAATGRGEALVALHLLDANERLTPAFDIDGAWIPHDMAWRNDTTLVLLGHAALLDSQGQEQRNDADTVALLYAIEAQTLSDVVNGIDDQPPRLEPSGDYLPLLGHDGGPLLELPPSTRHIHWPHHNDLSYVCHEGVFALLPRAGGLPSLRLPRLRVRPLIAVPQPHRVTSGWRSNALPAWSAHSSDPVLAPSVIDSHDPQTTWSRLWAEADVPRGCAAVVWLAASDMAPPPLPSLDQAFFASSEVGHAPSASTQWWPHLIGDASALPDDLAAWADLPRAVWHKRATEVMGGLSRLGASSEPPRPDERGLFEALVQRAGVAVRQLQGRRLWVAVELFGNGRDTPTLAALRVTGSRFSYRDQYLPSLYGESLQGELANAPSPASGSDFLERMLASFESDFTRIEGDIAQAHVLTQAGSCPADYLDWLGQWLGLTFEAGLSEPRRRSMLRALPALWRLHGTPRGLELAIELASGGEINDEQGVDLISGGAISGGEVVVIENWRMRRTFATILGAELFDQDDPLIAGLTRSGNSMVGDSLILGDPLKPEFLALYRTIKEGALQGFDDPRKKAGVVQIKAGREQAKETLYDDLAFRVTVLVHNELAAQDMGLIRQVCQRAAPAHVQVDVIASTAPFICAVASLVGVDTYLLAADPGGRFTLQSGSAKEVKGSQLGGIDRLGEGATLDARLDDFDFSDGSQPAAKLAAPALQAIDQPLLLDGRASRASPGRNLIAYRWRLNERP